MTPDRPTAWALSCYSLLKRGKSKAQSFTMFHVSKLEAAALVLQVWATYSTFSYIIELNLNSEWSVIQMLATILDPPLRQHEARWV